MKFKDNQLIWERYSDQQYENPLNPTFEDEDQEIVLDLEPDGPVEIDDDFDDMLEPTDDLEGGEGEMDDLVMTDIKKLDRNTKKLLEYCKSNKLEDWMQAKIIKASIYVADGFEQSDNIDL